MGNIPVSSFVPLVGPLEDRPVRLHLGLPGIVSRAEHHAAHTI
ncbi:MAG: hypothetical protein ACE5GZ_05945 [Gammaproteobacteria bacterium]